MDISRNWLKKYVTIPNDVDAKTFGEQLTLATVEVEGWRSVTDLLDKVVVGKVVRLWKHPNASKLQLTEVDYGDGTVQVVCGGTNLSEGMLVAFAPVGAKVLWHGEGEPVELAKVKIRGEESFGMICAAEEIGLGGLFSTTEETHILDLSSKKFKVGTPLATALQLDDVIYDIDNKSLTNRPDLWGHYGMAREVAAIYKTSLKPYETKKIVASKKESLSVVVEDKTACPRYMAVMIDNVTVSQSPDWLVTALQSVGLRSINTIVDITNYVLMDLGQPMHAFDAAKIAEDALVVRKAVSGEKFTTLDEEELTLTPEDLVIADSVHPVALAGVMGGLHSGISGDTTKIIFESANFNATTIRKTSARHNIRSDSSQRFEKSLDPEMTQQALEKAVALLLELSPGARVVSSVIDRYPKPAKPTIIHTSYDFLTKRIGQALPVKEMKDTLERLGFRVTGNDSISVTVPTWRATKDVSIPEDLVEEVARMFGYDNLTPVMPLSEVRLPEGNSLRSLEWRLREILSKELHCTEVYNYSFVTDAQEKLIGTSEEPHITLLNPASEGEGTMRRTLVHGLLNNVEKNIRNYDDLSMYEIGHVFLPEPGTQSTRPTGTVFLPAQPLHVSGVVTSKGDIEPFFMAKGIIEQIAHSLGVRLYFDVPPSVSGWLHPYRTVSVFMNEKVLGTISEIHPGVLNDLGVKQSVGYWDLDVSLLEAVYEPTYAYTVASKYPAIELDVAVVVDGSVAWGDIKRLVQAAGSELIKSVSLFDVYKNDKIGVGKRSIAFRVTYQSDERTLSMEEVQTLHQHILKKLEDVFQVSIRK